MTPQSAPAPDALVAVVTPVYNGGKHLEEAILAVQAQTYRPLVHCIVDNASTDETADILAKYANADVPIITRRNDTTISFQENHNAVLELMPPETKYFRMLHADDTMPPDAIAAMMQVARSADDIVMLSGAERLNGVDRPHRIPPEASVFDAANMIARMLVDEAHLPCAQTMFRIDAIREGEPFYPVETVECLIEAQLRVLSRGGRAGFVHTYNGDTRRYEGSGSLIKTLAPRVKAVIWEKLRFIEQYGPAALSNTEYKMVKRRFLRVFYRRLLWWMVSGRGDIVRRDVARLRERGLAPSLWGYFSAVAIWPYYLWNKRFAKPFAPLRWPDDAVKAGG